MATSWNVNLISNDQQTLKTRTADGLCGVVHHRERVIVLFDAELAMNLPVVASWDDSQFVRLFCDEKLYAIIDGERVEVRVVPLKIHQRTPFKFSHLLALSQKKVLMVGLGSMGSFIALMLARAGVEQFILCDPDRVEVCNVSRHEAMLPDVGRFKVDVIAERIKLINPRAHVLIFAEDLFAQPLPDVKAIFKKSSLVIASTDKRSVQLQTNKVAWQVGTPVVFAGCYEEARGGEVFCTFPQTNRPCYCCLRGGMPEPKRGPIDYSKAMNAGDYRGEPGLYASVSLVSTIAVEAALSVLLFGTDADLSNLFTHEQQYLLVGGARAQNFMRFRKPFDIFWQPLKGPRKLCPVCQSSNDQPYSSDVVLEVEDLDA